MKSFIIIEHEPLTERLKQIWNIDALREREVHVEYWDISKYVYPQANIPMTVEDNCVKHIETIEEFEKDEVVKEALGKHVSYKYVQSKKGELEEYCKTVTDWELKKYLNIY